MWHKDKWILHGFRRSLMKMEEFVSPFQGSLAFLSVQFLIIWKNPKAIRHLAAGAAVNMIFLCWCVERMHNKGATKALQIYIACSGREYSV